MKAVLIATLALSGVLAAQAPKFAEVAQAAAVARESNRIEEALGLYRRAVVLKPDWEEGWWYLGTLLYDRSSYRECADAFRKAVTLNPKNGTSAAMLGLCEYELGDDAALAHLQTGIRLGLAGGETLHRVVAFHEAVLLHKAVQFEEARERLQALCRSGAETADLDRVLGLSSLRLRSARDPDEAAVMRVGQAQCLAGQKKFDEARRVYQAVVAEHPDLTNLHLAYGRFLVESGDAASGVEELKRELVRDPGNTTARLQIAAAYYKVDSAAGLQYAEEAVRTDPNVPLGHYLLGLLLLDTDDYRRAILELESARKSFPREPRLTLALSSAYARAGRDKDAARLRSEFERMQQATQ